MTFLDALRAFSAGQIDIVMDRREAIKRSLSYAKKQDVVILTGKGSEPWICVEHGKKIPWSEADAVKEEFQKIGGEAGLGR